MNWRGIIWSVVLVLMAFYAMKFVQRGCGAPSIKVGAQAPGLSATLVGRQTAAESLFKGSAHALVFFATWCRSCRSELPVIQRVTRERPSMKVLVVSDEDVGLVADYLRKQGLKLNAAGNGGGVFAAYGIKVLPTTVVVGADGRVAFAEPGGGSVSSGLDLLVSMNGG